MHRCRHLVVIIVAGLFWAAAHTGVSEASAPEPVFSGQSDWSWGAPGPQGEDLAAISFSGAHGYAVGTVGTILRSTDGGKRWKGLPSGTVEGLDAVQQIGHSTVVAAGGCAAVESTNSGRTFSTLDLGLTSKCPWPVIGIAFSNARHGYVELADGTLELTTDSGRKFRAVKRPPLGKGHATGIAFSSATKGLAISSAGLIARTTNGGRSWKRVAKAAHSLAAVKYLGSTRAFAVGSDGELEASKDGGKTWVAMPLTLDNSRRTRDLTSITCADRDTCLMTTGDHNQIIRTTDGGRTGHLVTSGQFALRALAFVGGSRVVGVGDFGDTVLSHDGGQTFPGRPADEIARRFQFSGGPLVAGLAKGTAYLPGVNSVVATDDSGARWRLLHIPSRTDSDGTYASDQVAFITARTGYAMDTRGVLSRTRDGGRRWRRVGPRHSRHSLLVAPTAKVLLLIGPKGVRRSVDGGRSFRAVGGAIGDSGRPVSGLESLIGAQTSHGVVVAWSQNRIVMSADTGLTWNYVPRPLGLGYNSIDEADVLTASRLWLIGGGHTPHLYSTADGGREWHKLLGTGGLGTDATVSFSSPKDGLIGLDSAAGHAIGTPFGYAGVLSTRDGGRTWSPEVVGGSGGDVLATSTADLAFLETASDGSGGSYGGGLFTSRDSGMHRCLVHLTVAFKHSQLTTAQLAHGSHHVIVRGHLSPVTSPDESVAISDEYRGGHWRVEVVPVNARGNFRLKLSRVKGNVELVAQALGNGRNVAGAGTPVERLHVTR